MTIVEFLTARLDEDEHTTRKALARYQDALGIPHYFTTNSDTSVAMTPRVALAEIETKRMIVKMHGQAVAIDAVLDQLAAIYADHPDFDPAWRVDA